jgi:hypothetical protein
MLVLGGLGAVCHKELLSEVRILWNAGVLVMEHEVENTRWETRADEGCGSFRIRIEGGSMLVLGRSSIKRPGNDRQLLFLWLFYSEVAEGGQLHAAHWFVKTEGAWVGVTAEHLLSVFQGQERY